MTQVFILLVILIICEIVAIRSKYTSIWSPLGMLGVVICSALMISPIFMDGGDLAGWIMVGITVFFYFILIRAIKLYFKKT